MKKIISLLISLTMIFSSFCSFAIDLDDAYTEFKEQHPEFVNSIIGQGISEDTLLSFIYDVYYYLQEVNEYTPVTPDNFENHAIKAINTVSSREQYSPLQDALFILYPDAIRLALRENKVSDEFKPLVETIKRILFAENNSGDTTPGTTTGNNPSSTPNTPVVSQNPFTDINESHWAYTSVKHLADKYILSGYLDGTFKPDFNITRAEFAKIIVSATGTFDYTATSSFSDVSDNDWYYSYVSTAYRLKYITGYPDGSFHPNDNITRADICTIVNRVLKAAPDGSVAAFYDDWAIPAYARDSVYALAAKGIINGYGDGTFSPTAYATRAQTAKIIYTAFFQK